MPGTKDVSSGIRGRHSDYFQAVYGRPGFGEGRDCRGSEAEAARGYGGLAAEVDVADEQAAGREAQVV